MADIILSRSDFDSFKAWINLDITSITWEGRYQREFIEFWNTFFKDGITLLNLLKNFNYAKEFLKGAGPAITWFVWLEKKFICFLFIKKGLDLFTIAEGSHLSLSTIALILRDFFIERFPHLENRINEEFLLGTVVSSNMYLTYEKVKESFSLKVDVEGSLQGELMLSIEVTLYQEWHTFLKNLKDEDRKNSIDLEHFKKKISFKKQVHFFQELIILFLLGGILIFGLKVGNKWYEDYLSQKITLFEPDFFWLDNTLSFRTENSDDQKIDLSFKELDELEKIESKEVFSDSEGELRVDTESEVVVTSVDSLPRDFNVVNLDQSKYEESRKGGYHSSPYRRNKAYRVMMTSVHPSDTKSKVSKLLKYYEIEQADTVEPGTQIPGGLYFNLYVPSKNLKEFLTQVSVIEEATILESNATFGYRPGKNKVFIWVKSI